MRARCGLTVAEVSDEALTFGIDLASLILWGESGRRYGLCLRTVRPCWEGDRNHGFTTSTSWRSPASYPLTPLTVAGTGGAVDVYPTWPRLRECACHLPELLLPGPIAWVEEIMVDGVPVNLGNVAIRVDGTNARRVLTRNDGESWYCSNDLERDPTVVPLAPEPGPAWQVRYWRGRQVTDTMQIIAGKLAEQIGRQFCQDANCDANMVQGLTRVARRGVVKEYDPSAIRDDNGQVATGLRVVDDWLRTVNPHGRKRAPAILRADDPERRRMWRLVDAA